MKWITSGINPRGASSNLWLTSGTAARSSLLLTQIFTCPQCGILTRSIKRLLVSALISNRPFITEHTAVVNLASRCHCSEVIRKQTSQDKYLLFLGTYPAASGNYLNQKLEIGIKPPKSCTITAPPRGPSFLRFSVETKPQKCKARRYFLVKSERLDVIDTGRCI